MIKLNLEKYKDKVYACWLGKNIGGTLGGPYEGSREKLSVTGYVTPKGEPLPNDDLDLQLIWFAAIQREGVKNFTAEKLGNYWQTFMVADYAEYGIAKQNMSLGLYPHVSGDYNNEWKHSNGAWIRTEIWATLSPACPNIAVNYAIEDARVDHGTGEGTVAAAFIAALESAAFVVSDIRKLIEIGLNNISKDSRVYKTVKLVIKSYDSGLSADKTRELIIKENADIGDGWFQAPSNIGFVILGLLYGEGDFKKSVLYAVNCGDDTDCTAGTTGAILGIVLGSKGIPSDWVEYIGDKIITICINRTNAGYLFPETCTELTERIVDFCPAVLIENDTDVRLTSDKDEIPDNVSEIFSKHIATFSNEQDDLVYREVNSEIPCSFIRYTTAFTIITTYEDKPEISSGEEKKITFRVLSNVKSHGNVPLNIRVRLIDMPEGFSVDKKDFYINVLHWTTLSREWMSKDVSVTIKAEGDIKASNKFVFEFSREGFYDSGYVPVVFVGR